MAALHSVSRLLQELIALPSVNPTFLPAGDIRTGEQRVAALRERLLADIPADGLERTAEQWSRWRLAYLLDWHRREAKAGWWEYYRLVEMPEEDLFDEPSAVAGLEFVERVELVLHKTSGKPTGAVVDRYRYPPQEMEIRGRDEVKQTDVEARKPDQSDQHADAQSHG